VSPDANLANGSPGDDVLEVEQNSQYQSQNTNASKTPYERAMENKTLRENCPKRKSPPSQHMQVLLHDSHGLALQKAVILADYAHDDGALTPVTLNHKVDYVDADGSYRPKDGAVTARIGVRRECAFPLLTTLHEIGHHLRKHLDPADVADVAEAARQSEGAKLCQELGVDVEYWLSDSELFSRIYAQWVIERTGAPEAIGELNKIKGSPDFWQQFDGKVWTETTEKMNIMMEKKGWL
jgi:hypothetical protein